MKKLISIVLLLSLAILLSACCLSHEWIPATCTAPQTCAKCGETEGTPIGHTWINATCTAAKTCSVCGETEGEPLGHEWIEATCTTPKTCARCSKTEGGVAEHKFGQWKVSNKATYFDEGKNVRTCSVCGYEEAEYTDKLDIISKFPYSKERFDSKGYFTFNTEELAALVDYYLPTSYTVTYNSSDKVGLVYKSDSLVSMISTDKTWIDCFCSAMDMDAGDVICALVQAASINAGKSDVVNMIGTMEWLDEGTGFASNNDLIMFMRDEVGDSISFSLATVKFGKSIL